MTTTAGMIVGPARQLAYVAADVAALAADLVLESVGRASAARTKSTPTDVVTHTDLESEELIRRELSIRCPGSLIVGEELDDADGVNSIGWIVDPIDGTVNFLYDLPVVSVSIAATIDGEVVAGAVADIVRGEVFDAALGGGARLDGVAIGPSTVTDLGQSLVGTGFSYEADVRSEQAERLLRVLPASRDIRCMGSAALNLCWVGCGRLDGYFEHDLKPYDYAAGALIAAEAGATVISPTTQRDRLNVATAPGVFGQLHALL